MRIHLGNEGGVTRMGKYFIDSPAYQGRLAVTGIVLGGVGVDTVDNHAVRLLVVEHGSDVVLGQFGVEFGGSGTEAPAIPCPKADEIAYGMARDDTFVKQSTAVCPPIGDERGDGFHGDTVIFGLHILAQYLGEVTFPTFGVGLQGGGGIVEQARQVLQVGSHLFFGSEERDGYVDRVARRADEGCIVIVGLGQLYIRSEGHGYGFATGMTGDDGVLFYADGNVFAPLATGEQQVFSRVGFDAQQGGRGTCEVEPLRDAPVGGMCRHIELAGVIASGIRNKNVLCIFGKAYDGG